MKRNMFSGGSNGVLVTVRPPSNFFHFHAVFGKNIFADSRYRDPGSIIDAYRSIIFENILQH